MLYIRATGSPTTGFRATSQSSTDDGPSTDRATRKDHSGVSGALHTLLSDILLLMARTANRPLHLDALRHTSCHALVITRAPVRTAGGNFQHASSFPRTSQQLTLHHRQPPLVHEDQHAFSSKTGVALYARCQCVAWLFLDTYCHMNRRIAHSNSAARHARSRSERPLTQCPRGRRARGRR